MEGRAGTGRTMVPLAVGVGVTIVGVGVTTVGVAVGTSAACKKKVAVAVGGGRGGECVVFVGVGVGRGADFQPSVVDAGGRDPGHLRRMATAIKARL